MIAGYRLDLDPPALGLPLAAYIRVRPAPGQLARVVECHRITGEDCFILKVYPPAVDRPDRLLDRFLLYGITTTSLVQSSPVPPGSLPLPER